MMMMMMMMMIIIIIIIIIIFLNGTESRGVECIHMAHDRMKCRTSERIYLLWVLDGEFLLTTSVFQHGFSFMN